MRCRRTAVHRVLHPSLGDEGGGRLPQRDVDVLTAAGAAAGHERGENTGRRRDATRRVAVRDPELFRRASGVPAERREPRQRNDGRAIPHVARLRAGVAVAGDRRHDDVGPDLLESLVAKAEPLHHSGGEILHDHVAARDQPLRHVDALRRSEIQEHALLPLVPLIEVAGAIERVLHPDGKDRQPARGVGAPL